MPPQTRTILLGLAVLATAAPGPALGGSGRFDVTRFGVKADGKTDNSAALQRIVDALTGPSTLVFPSGEYRFKWPVYIDKPQVHIRGAGRGVTVLKPMEVDAPPLVFGLRQVEKKNQRVTEAHRPDAVGVLDATIAPARGVFRGFATRGNAYAVATANPAQVGQLNPLLNGLRHYDYYGGMRGLTVEIALRLPHGMKTFPRETTIIGLGSGRNPGPWHLGVDAAGQFLFSFRTSDQGVDPGAPIHAARFSLPPNARGPVYRMRVWVDFDTGATGVAVNGTPVTPSWEESPSFTNKRFAKNRGQYPFFLGPAPGMYITSLNCGKVPEFDVLAFRVSRVARKSEARDDRGRYGDDDDAIVFLKGDGPAARHLSLGCNRMATASTGCVAFVLTTEGTDGGIMANSVADLTVWGGGQSIAVGGVLDFSVSECEISDGFVGVGSIPLGMNYPILLRNLRTCGWDAGISLSRAFVRLYAVDIGGGGICSARFSGCTVGWYSGMVQFFDPEGECCLDFIGDEAGGAITLMDFYVDNEAAAFSDSVIRVDNHPYGPITSLYVRNLSSALVGEKATVLHLRGKADDRCLGSVDAAGLIYLDPKMKSAVRVSGPWKGRIDLRGLANQKVEGEAPAGLEILKGGVRP